MMKNHVQLKIEKYSRAFGGSMILAGLSFALQDLGVYLLKFLSYLQTFWLIAVLAGVLIQSLVYLVIHVKKSKALEVELAVLKSYIHDINPDYVEEMEFGKYFDEAIEADHKVKF